MRSLKSDVYFEFSRSLILSMKQGVGARKQGVSTIIAVACTGAEEGKGAVGAPPGGTVGGETTATARDNSF
jgi:hypothetical protein